MKFESHRRLCDSLNSMFMNCVMTAIFVQLLLVLYEKHCQFYFVFSLNSQGCRRNSNSSYRKLMLIYIIFGILGFRKKVCFVL